MHLAQQSCVCNSMRRANAPSVQGPGKVYKGPIKPGVPALTERKTREHCEGGAGRVKALVMRSWDALCAGV